MGPRTRNQPPMDESVAGESGALSDLGTEMNEREEETEDTVPQQAEHSVIPAFRPETRDEREELKKELEVLKLRSEITRLHKLLD
jgi:hypothetical protein